MNAQDNSIHDFDYEPIHNAEVTSSGRLVARKRTYTVFTVPINDGTWKMYHCPDCKRPLAQYKGDLVAEVPGLVENGYPVLIQCKNPKCGRKIMFKGTAEQV